MFWQVFQNWLTVKIYKLVATNFVHNINIWGMSPVAIVYAGKSWSLKQNKVILIGYPQLNNNIWQNNSFSKYWWILFGFFFNVFVFCYHHFKLVSIGCYFVRYGLWRFNITCWLHISCWYVTNMYVMTNDVMLKDHKPYVMK